MPVGKNICVNEQAQEILDSCRMNARESHKTNQELETWPGGFKYSCLIQRGKSARAVVDFFKGTGHFDKFKGPIYPHISEVLYCVASDIVGIINSPKFEDWAQDYGYSEDSRKAYAIFQAIEVEKANFSGLFTQEELYILADMENEQEQEVLE